MKIKILFLAVLLGFSIACKKNQHRYPEDPNVTKITPQKRLEGSWTVNAYTYNGLDIISKLDTFYSGESKIKDVGFGYAQDPDTKVWEFSVINQYFINFESESAFDTDDPDYIKLYNDNVCCRFLLSKWFITPFKYIPNASTKWRITKLYNSELNLILQTDTGDYKMFLKKLK